MIINTGMRTDIPAFYSEWLCNRLKEGYVCTRNPYNPRQVTRYQLNPDVVDVMAFCTKNPAPMLPHMELLENYGQYWFVTVTPFGKEIEPNVPPKEQVLQSFVELSKIVGADSMGWRYDPIFLNDTYTAERHLHDFEVMASALAGATHSCVISFIDLYEKVKRNFPEVRSVPRQERLRLGEEMVKIAGKYGMTIRPCAEGDDLARFGADCSGCMTLSTFETAIHGRLNAPKKKTQRTECACMLGSDVGQYDTCGHFCRYCYANTSVVAVRQNMKKHDPKSPLLVGTIQPEDVIHEAKQEKWRDEQLSLFDWMHA